MTRIFEQKATEETERENGKRKRVGCGVFWSAGIIVGMNGDSWPRFTLQHVAMIVCVVCIWSAQLSIRHRYLQSPFADMPEVPRLAAIKTPPVEARVLGLVNLIIVCAAIAFRRHGKRAAWTAIGAACLATAIAAVVAAVRYSQ